MYDHYFSSRCHNNSKRKLTKLCTGHFNKLWIVAGNMKENIEARSSERSSYWSGEISKNNFYNLNYFLIIFFTFFKSYFTNNAIKYRFKEMHIDFRTF